MRINTKYLKTIFGLVLSLSITSYAGENRGFVGENGGGGYLIPSQLKTPDDLSRHIQSEILERSQLHSLFNGLQYYLAKGITIRPKPELELMKLLFDKDPGKQVFDILPKIDWQITTSNPCYKVNDKGVKEPIDGAVISRSKLKVCISTLRISKKTSEVDFHKATMGLMAHEVIHLMGGSEKQASEISSIVDQLLRTKYYYHYSSHIGYRLEDLFSNLNISKDFFFNDKNSFSISDQIIFLQRLERQACEVKNETYNQLKNLSSAVSMTTYELIKNICIQTQILSFYGMSNNYLSTVYRRLDLNKFVYTYANLYNEPKDKNKTKFYVPLGQNSEVLRMAIESIKSQTLYVLKRVEANPDFNIDYQRLMVIRDEVLDNM
ncbi:hypothetical protein OAQ84_00360 [Bdellovibrionales bacterium]|nr:hypothetical protein [Bdellovibrionales bacterium]